MPPRPLQKRTMTLGDLQERTLRVIRRTKDQFHRAAHDEGMTDQEFIEDQLDPLATDIWQDQQILKALAKSEWIKCPTEQGWWLWWNGDPDSSPVPVSILSSGHGEHRRLFASIGQLGWNTTQWVEDMGGIWKEIDDSIPDLETQALLTE